MDKPPEAIWATSIDGVVNAQARMPETYPKAEYLTKYIRDDLTVKVKKLEWEDGLSSGISTSKNGMTYRYKDTESGFLVWRGDHYSDEYVIARYLHTRDEAKAAAQAHFDNLIKSALEL